MKKAVESLMVANEEKVLLTTCATASNFSFVCLGFFFLLFLCETDVCFAGS